jgi:hypothetical protein
VPIKRACYIYYIKKKEEKKGRICMFALYKRLIKYRLYNNNNNNQIVEICDFQENETENGRGEMTE